MQDFGFGNKMNVAEYIAKQLKADGIDCVFGYQGGNITYLIDAITRADNIRYVQSYNEQGAAFAANSYASVSEKYGVAVSSSGPGAINLMNGIANAFYDSIPCLFITGNINTRTMKDKETIRQNGFQEADIVGMASVITKYAKTILKPEDIIPELSEALRVMLSGRPGPVLLDIPHNIQRSELSDQLLKDSCSYTQEMNESEEQSDEEIKQLLKPLSLADRPLLLVGNACRSREKRRLLREFLVRYPIPVVTSLNGIDAVDYKYNYGMIGSFGLDGTNEILNQADCLLVLGSRMDERQRFGLNKNMLQGKTVIHVEIDPSEMKHAVPDEITIRMDCGRFLQRMLSGHIMFEVHGDWVQKAGILKSENYILGQGCADSLSSVFTGNHKPRNYSADVGCNQMAAAQTVRLQEGEKYLNSAGLGSMGFSIPAAIGAYYADPMKKSVAICGDGGFMMNLQELQWIKREHLPISILVVNNHALEMIAGYQRLAFQGRTTGSVDGYEAPDLDKIALAFSLNYRKVNAGETITVHDEAEIIEVVV